MTLKENIKLVLIQQIKIANVITKTKSHIIFKVPILEIFEIFSKIDSGTINEDSAFR